MATILLTGATGYIGSHTWLSLLEAGFSVVGVDDFSNSSPEVLNRLRTLAGRAPVFERLDVRDTAALARVLRDHGVDAVVHFEGERGHPYRVLRAAKNRFGSTNEIGVFEMHADGLREVQNPSALFLAERPVGVPGSAVVAALEGSRPLLVEVQALVAGASGMPRRTALGVDPNRVSMLLAVMARRASYDVLDQDVFVNIVGLISADQIATIAEQLNIEPLRKIKVKVNKDQAATKEEA